jgi:hypothetical protein
MWLYHFAQAALYGAISQAFGTYSGWLSFYFHLRAWGIVLQRVSAADKHFASLFRDRESVLKHIRAATSSAASFWQSVVVLFMRFYANGVFGKLLFDLRKMFIVVQHMCLLLIVCWKYRGYVLRA